jgi:hypothetical protein
MVPFSATAKAVAHADGSTRRSAALAVRSPLAAALFPLPLLA